MTPRRSNMAAMPAARPSLLPMLARHGAVTLGVCLLIATLLTWMEQGRWDVNLVYSLSIGLTSWLTIDLGRRLLSRGSDIPWPQGWRGVALVVLGIAFLRFLTLMGIFQVNTWVALFATSGVIFSACYGLWLYRRVMLGQLIKESLKAIKDLTTREKAIFAPLVVMTLLLGVYPALVTDIINPTVDALIGQYDLALNEYAPALELASAGGQ